MDFAAADHALPFKYGCFACVCTFWRICTSGLYSQLRLSAAQKNLNNNLNSCLSQRVRLPDVCFCALAWGAGVCAGGRVIGRGTGVYWDVGPPSSRGGLKIWWMTGCAKRCLWGTTECKFPRCSCPPWLSGGPPRASAVWFCYSSRIKSGTLTVSFSMSLPGWTLQSAPACWPWISFTNCHSAVLSDQRPPHLHRWCWQSCSNYLCQVHFLEILGAFIGWLGPPAMGAADYSALWPASAKAPSSFCRTGIADSSYTSSRRPKSGFSGARKEVSFLLCLAPAARASWKT